MKNNATYEPPKVATKLLRVFCDEHWVEVEGDLREQYKETVRARGQLKAKFQYWKDVVGFFRPHILKRSNRNSNNPRMIKNYFKTAYRSLFKDKVYAAINITGLTMGIAGCILISLYVFDELSYDKFFPNSENIYRIALERKYPDHTRNFASSSVMLAPTLLEYNPEVVKATRLHRLFFQDQVIVTIDDKTFEESQFRFADSLFFDLFEFEFLEGNSKTALDAPDKVVITDKIALKYFGEGPALNKTLNAFDSEFIVAGVIKDIPENSHMDIDIFGSVRTIGYLNSAIDQNNWVNPWLYTYIQLAPGADAEEFEAKLPFLIEEHGAATLERQLGMSVSEYRAAGHEYNYFLQPVESIHLYSNQDTELQPNGNVMYVYLMSMVVAFILLISCINFVNLATARSTERAKEVGVRKVMGSNRGHLIKQFLFESTFVSLVSLLLGVLVVKLLLPVFNMLAAKNLTFDILTNPMILFGLFGFALFVGLLAGLYPALVISGLKPAQVLKGKFISGAKGVWLRNSLVVFQFGISIILISATIIVNNQMQFISAKSLGFERENVVVISQARALGESSKSFTDKLAASSEVISVGGTTIMPGGFMGSNIFNLDDPELAPLRANVLNIDDDFMPTLNMAIAQGRGFEKEYNDSLSVVINQAAAKVLGWEDPIGHTVSPGNAGNQEAPRLTIVGVVEDFNFESLHKMVYPIILRNTNTQFVPPLLAVRLESGDISEKLKFLREEWNTIVPDQEMIYSFFDDDLNALYKSEQASGKIFQAFSILAILLACIGLFGLAAYVTQQRAKEIGVRKVLGASVLGILVLLSKDFSKLIGLAFLFAVPLAFFGMQKWLETFAYHIDPGVPTFVFAGLFTLVLALATISYQSLKSAVANPVKSIRSE